jgi:hypothetical protein
MTKTPEYVEMLADGTVIERPWTPEELAQQQKDRDDWAAAQAATEAAAATAAANAAAAIAHAKSLGFTDAMISAMYPALVTVAP